MEQQSSQEETLLRLAEKELELEKKQLEINRRELELQKKRLTIMKNIDSNNKQASNANNKQASNANNKQASNANANPFQGLSQEEECANLFNTFFKGSPFKVMAGGCRDERNACDQTCQIQKLFQGAMDYFHQTFSQFDFEQQPFQKNPLDFDLFENK